MPSPQGIKYSSMLLAISMFMVLSCTTKRDRFEGNWVIQNDGSASMIFTLNVDSLTFYDYTALLCDTFVPRWISSKTVDRIISKNDLTASIEMDGKLHEIRIRLLSDSTGEFCEDGECFDIKRTGELARIDLSTEDRLLLGWKYEIANEIIQSQREFDWLSSSAVLSEDAIELIAYLDSARADLLSQFRIDYDAVVCWQREDSILAYKTPSEILIGEPYAPIAGRFSGRGVGRALSTYLKSFSPTPEVKTLFPEYSADGLAARDSDGTFTYWATLKFYHRPLGRIIAELNTLKVRVVQLELIRAELRTSR